VRETSAWEQKTASGEIGSLASKRRRLGMTTENTWDNSSESQRRTRASIRQYHGSLAELSLHSGELGKQARRMGARECRETGYGHKPQGAEDAKGCRVRASGLCFSGYLGMLVDTSGCSAVMTLSTRVDIWTFGISRIRAIEFWLLLRLPGMRILPNQILQCEP